MMIKMIKNTKTSSFLFLPTLLENILMNKLNSC